MMVYKLERDILRWIISDFKKIHRRPNWLGLRLGRHQKWGWVKQHLERNITGKKYVSETKKINITGRSSFFIHKDLLNWGSRHAVSSTWFAHFILHLHTLSWQKFRGQVWRITNFLKIPRKPFLANFLLFSWSWQTLPVQLILTDFPFSWSWQTSSSVDLDKRRLWRRRRNGRREWWRRRDPGNWMRTQSAWN